MANATVYVATTGSDSTGDGSSGNPYATPGKAGSVITTTGNTIYIKAGTYTFTSGSTNVAGGLLSPPAGASGAPNRVIGYNTTPGDLDAVNDWSNFPVLKGAASGPVRCLYFANDYCHARNLVLDGNAQASHGLDLDGLCSEASNCKAVNCSSYGLESSGQGSRLHRCLASACGYGFYVAGHSSTISGCVATANTVVGFRTDSYAMHMLRCIAYANTGATVDGFTHTGNYGSVYINCVAHGNGRDGIRLADAASADSVVVRNCIIMSNGGYGVNSVTTTWADALIDYNFFRLNTSGDYNKLPAGAHDVDLSGDPFQNAAGADFSLNSTAGAGAAVRAAGWPGVMPGGTTTGYLDGGAIQHQDPAASGFVAPRPMVIQGIGTY